MSFSNYKQSNSSLASYEPSKPYPQLDGHSDSRRNIPEGGLAKDNVSETTIKPQDNTLPTIIVKAPLPSPILSTFSFLVSFEKFHVTAASKAGYNKIYKCRRSKSFFFEVVDQIPDTNEIHLKIYTNDHHMSSTPIRFHFGIYVACNHLPTKKSPHQKPTPCRTPYPFVKNFNRHACNQHHSAITHIINTPSEDKATSAPATGPMYTKIYKNFSRTLSSNPRTAAQQKAHFDRSCRRIFNSNKPKSGMALKLRYKIRLANQRKFLFCPYQKIYTRIPHLKFNMGLFKRFPTVPLFRFPYDQNCALLHLPEDRIFPPHISSALRSIIKNQDSDEEDNSSANNGRDDTSENSYRDWYIKNLIDEHYGKGASEYIDAVLLLQDSTIQLSLRDAYMLGLDEDRINIEDHNTSAKHYLRRTNAMEFFTRLNDNFDDRMASIRNFAYGASKKKSNDKRTVASRRLNNLITDFGQQYRDEHYPFKPYHAIIRPNDI
ncbi:hypothetical protein RhiirA5_424074 [Rhizophagus irregularis]|uniref:DUF8211 domain-containing protein n=1 Tax=Rhizophagus irregularis TaxID=588596 RepID=A0A2N0NVF0_9GLOM|nr:hypothetical protein RhiirA5_431200 [Rhizophagus irregularis]PKC03235.1 hypothetical protein RhiirA5_424074 [Rhizophagus irregularis]